MVRYLVVILCMAAFFTSVPGEEITLIQGENGYTGFRTDNISNPGHLERCTWKNHWATDAPFIGENTWRADVCDYCC